MYSIPNINPYIAANTGNSITEANIIGCGHLNSKKVQTVDNGEIHTILTKAVPSAKNIVANRKEINIFPPDAVIQLYINHEIDALIANVNDVPRLVNVFGPVITPCRP